VSKLNNLIVNYLKIPNEYRGPHVAKDPCPSTCHRGSGAARPKFEGGENV